MLNILQTQIITAVENIDSRNSEILKYRKQIECFIRKLGRLCKKDIAARRKYRQKSNRKSLIQIINF